MAERFNADEIAFSANLPVIAASYFEVTKQGREYKFLCQWHQDTNPSATLYQKGNGWRYKCFVCGEQGNAIDFVMAMDSCSFVDACSKLTGKSNGGNGSHPVTPALRKAPPRITTKPPADCLPPPFATKQGEPSRIYPYLDADGELLGYGAVYDGETAYWTWGARSENDPPKWEKKPFRPALLYGLEQLSRKKTAQVLVCHDEAAAEAGIALFPTLAVVSWAGGEHAQAEADWSAILGRDKPVILLPRNDPLGAQIMSRLAVHLYALGIDTVKGINTETYGDNVELPQGWSIADGTIEDGMAWAKTRVTVYPLPDDAPIQGDIEPEAAEWPPIENYTPIDAEMLPEASTPLESPAIAIPDASATSRKRRKPALGVVDGNTVRAPRQEIDPEADLPPAFSEDALAEAFTLTAGVDWRYTAAWGVWHKWTGTRWEEDAKQGAVWDARLLCRDKSNEPTGDLTKAGRQKIATLKTAKNVLSLASADPRHATTSDQWDADPLLLGTPAGVIHLPTARLFPPDKTQLISRQTLVAPARGPHPLWDSVLARSTDGDPEMAAYLAKWAGLMLSGVTKEEVFAFIHGVGGSGKSTFISALQTIMGDYAKTASIEVITADGKKDSSELAELVGARLVVVNETRENSRWDEQTITTITGRDEIRARNLYQTGFRYRPQFKLCVVGNHKPQLRSVGEHIRRRLHLIEFHGIPEGERDVTLKDRLVDEFPAILAWMIDGFAAYQESGGLGYPKAVRLAVTDYLQSEDTTGAWFEDCCERQEAARTPVGDAYQSFKTWAEGCGEYVGSQKRFSQRLKDRGFDTGKSGVRYFLGFSIKSDPQRNSYSSRDD